MGEFPLSYTSAGSRVRAPTLNPPFVCLVALYVNLVCVFPKGTKPVQNLVGKNPVHCDIP